MAEELERPLIQSHDRQLRFCHNAVRQIVAGAEWPGMPHLDVEIFIHTAEKAMWGLDVLKPDDRAAIKRLQEAILIQKQLSMENNMQQQLDNSQQGGISSNMQGTLPGPAPGSVGPPASGPGGPPESINPLTSPTGAAGGLGVL